LLALSSSCVWIGTNIVSDCNVCVQPTGLNHAPTHPNRHPNSYGGPSAQQQADALRSSVAAQFTEPTGAAAANPAAAPPPSSDAAAASAPQLPPPTPGPTSDTDDDDDDDDKERFNLAAVAAAADSTTMITAAARDGGAGGRGKGGGGGGGHHQEGSVLLRDAFLVFRALCKLSIRTSDSATLQDPTAVRGKVRRGWLPGLTHACAGRTLGVAVARSPVRSARNKHT
jgi:hypothetical protein